MYTSFYDDLPSDLVFNSTWPIFKLNLDIVQTNFLTEFHKDSMENEASIM